MVEIKVNRKNLRKLLVCATCHKVMKEPVTVRECLHSFCSECLPQPSLLVRCPKCDAMVRGGGEHTQGAWPDPWLEGIILALRETEHSSKQRHKKSKTSDQDDDFSYRISVSTKVLGGKPVKFYVVAGVTLEMIKMYVLDKVRRQLGMKSPLRPEDYRICEKNRSDKPLSQTSTFDAVLSEKMQRKRKQREAGSDALDSLPRFVLEKRS